MQCYSTIAGQVARHQPPKAPRTMIRTTYLAERTGNDVVTMQTYGHIDIDGGARVVAVTWSDHVQWQDSSFEGPPEQYRRWELVVDAFDGLVVALGVDYGVRIMSDVWADLPFAVVLSNDGTFRQIGLGEGAAADKAKVDATDALKAVHVEAEACRALVAKIEGKMADKRRRAQDKAREAATPRKGKTVRVVRGRKVAKGTLGTIFWIGEGQYGTRLGIKDAAGVVHWTAATNVEVVQPARAVAAA